MKTPDAYPEIPTGRGDDLHHLDLVDAADLVLFMAGNQFMVMPELIDAFQARYPHIRTVYYQTLPPGLSLQQILAGGARFGNRVLDVTPDVYASVSKTAMTRLQDAGMVDPSRVRLYLHNRLSLMVPVENPAGIRHVRDLGRPEVRVSQPDPVYEDIAGHITNMYREAGGDALAERIMETKREEGTSLYTRVHHRETPLRIRLGTVDVGPVWATEVAHARRKGLPVSAVEPGSPLDQRDRVNYYLTTLNDIDHPDNAARFVDFITDAEAQRIYQKHGFLPHFP